jgi:pyridoxamine 5'-phosphate oxidase family protein
VPSRAEWPAAFVTGLGPCQLIEQANQQTAFSVGQPVARRTPLDLAFKLGTQTPPGRRQAQQLHASVGTRRRRDEIALTESVRSPRDIGRITAEMSRELAHGCRLEQPQDHARLRATRALGRVATVGRDGIPHVIPSGWTYNATLEAVDVTGRDVRTTKKFRDVRRTGKAAIVIDGVVPGDTFRPWAIEISGRAEAIEEPEALIRIHPERVRSWGLESLARPDSSSAIPPIGLPPTARPLLIADPPTGSRGAPDEGQELCLRVSIVGHLDAWSVLSALPEDLVQGQHALEHLGAAVGVERLVLARRTGQVPPVKEHVRRVDHGDCLSEGHPSDVGEVVDTIDALSVVEQRLDMFGMRSPRADGIVLDGGANRHDDTNRSLEERAKPVHQVAYDIPRNPAFDRRSRVPRGWHRPFDGGGEVASDATVILGDVHHSSSISASSLA